MEKSKNKSLRAWEIAALMALSLALCAGTWAQSRQQSISSALVRLHVIAVSDAAEEQEIKLEVRDAVLAYLTPALENAENQQQARQIITENLEGIARAAGSAAQGRQVSVTLPGSTRALPCPPGAMSPCGSFWARARERTGGAWCFRPSACPPRSVKRCRAF